MRTNNFICFLYLDTCDDSSSDTESTSYSNLIPPKKKIADNDKNVHITEVRPTMKQFSNFTKFITSVEKKDLHQAGIVKVLKNIDSLHSLYKI